MAGWRLWIDAFVFAEIECADLSPGGRGPGMIDSLLFVLSLGGMVLIVFWSLQNDKTPLDGETRGLLGMKKPEEEAASDARRGKAKGRLPTDRT
jgi:hypothetical protein